MSDEIDKSEIDVLREKNIQERNAFLASLMNDPLFSEAVKGISSFQKETNKSLTKATIKRRTGDSTFRFTGAIPKERRSSARLQHKKPEYNHQDLPVDVFSRDPDSLDDLEEIVYQVKRPRKSTPRFVPSKIFPVEEVTEDMINKIQTRGNKVYGVNGSSCHQCRQKTIDTKTVCRSGFCIGVRGQFCGICVINRYGEDPIKALKDPNWKCYVCRGCCNCSFCRAKAGKRPTGILAPLAKTSGYNSVMDFLRSLNGYGDYSRSEEDPENLLGFKGNYAVMGAKTKISVKSDYNIEEFKNAVHSFCYSAKDPMNLLGFDGNYAVMGSKERIDVKCHYDIENFKSTVKSICWGEKNPENLLGFDKNYMVMGDQTRIEIKSTYNLEEFQSIVV